MYFGFLFVVWNIIHLTAANLFSLLPTLSQNISSTFFQMVDDDDDGIPVQGSLSFQPTTSSNIGDPNFSTLDEPIHDTIVITLNYYLLLRP